MNGTYIGERSIPRARAILVNPSQASTIQSKGMRPDMLHCGHVPFFDRRGFREAGIVRMRAVQGTVDDHASVKVNDGPVLAAKPLREGLAGGLIMLGDGIVVDRVEVVPVDGHPLVRIGGIDRADGDAADLLFGPDGAVAHSAVEGSKALDWSLCLCNSCGGKE